MKDEIKEKNEQIAFLDKQIADSINASHNTMDQLELSQVSLAFLLVALAAFPFLRSQNLCCLLFYSAVCFCIDGAIE